MEQIRLILKRSDGFSLVEVMIALVLFALFITAYSVGFGTNVQNSARLDEEYLLHRLTEEILQTAIIDPPEYAESLTLTPQTKTFEEAEFSDYEYSIEYQRLELPDLSKIQGAEEEESDGGEGNSASGMQKRIFEQLRKNLEEIVWQVKVTVKNKKTEFSYQLSTYVTNQKAKVKLNF